MSFYFQDAVNLYNKANIENLIPHHFGMFDFNTIHPSKIKRKANQLDTNVKVIIPEIGRSYLIDNNY